MGGSLECGVLKVIRPAVAWEVQKMKFALTAYSLWHTCTTGRRVCFCPSPICQPFGKIKRAIFADTT